MTYEQEIKTALKNWPAIIQKYKKPSKLKAFIQMLNTFLPFAAIWVLMYFSLSWSYWITLALAIVNGFLLARIFIIQHDCGHNSFTGSIKWNKRIGWFCSLFSTLPFNYWAGEHNYHHKHTGQLEHRNIGDINFLTVDEYRTASKWTKFKYRLFRSFLVLFIFVPLYYFIVANRIPTIRYSEKSKFSLSQVINNLMLLTVFVGLGWLLGWKSFLLVHLPIVFIFSVVAFWFFYIQHQHDHTYMQWKDKWDYLLAAIRGSSYYKLPKVLHWFTGNIGFHHIHHLSSQIPNYNLPVCARENPVLQQYVNSITLWQSIKLVFNKLWDEEDQRMISFREYKKKMRTIEIG